MIYELIHNFKSWDNLYLEKRKQLVENKFNQIITKTMTKQDIKHSRTIKPLFKNIIIKGELEPTSIIVDNKKNQNITSLKVFLIGNEVTEVEVGDQVMVKGGLTTEARIINPFGYLPEDFKNEFYILIEEEELIGKFI